MSLINDALKQAKKSQSPNPPGGAPPLPPVETKSSGGSGWILILAAILFVAAICIFAGSLFLGQKNIPVPMTSAPEPVVAQIAVPTNSIEAPAPNALAEAAGQLPKVQGIIYDATYPLAIVDRKTVHIGDKEGNYKITAISRMSVTFQSADGSLQEIKISGQ